MDFTDQGTQPSETAPKASPETGSPKKKRDHNRLGRIGIAAIVAGVAVLLVAIAALIGFSSNTNEDQFVDTSKLQAVFLNTGQVYFGNITALNSKYLVLNNIYYPQSQPVSTVSTASGTINTKLLKLGCESYGPYDQMIINSDQVNLWENLQDSSQVATKISQFVKDNPNGLKCTDQSSNNAGNITLNVNTTPVTSSTTSSTTTPASSTTTSTKH